MKNILRKIFGDWFICNHKWKNIETQQEGVSYVYIIKCNKCGKIKRIKLGTD